MKHFLLLSLFAAGVASSHAQIVINELMQSNVDCIMDDLNEFPDSWVELYNTGSENINLKDYKLVSINKDGERGEYKLPSFQLAPNGHRLVYCDKYEKTKSWHAPFRLESAKDGSVYLYKGDEIVDKVEKIKKQPAPNIAYGRKTDGDKEWGYQAEPTPNKANCGTVYGNRDILGNPVFSIPGQVFETAKSLELTLSLPEGAPEGTVIRYTTDGSEPTEKSTQYTAPIKFSSSRVICAKLFCDGMLSPRSLAQSYLFLGRSMTLPVVSLVTNNDYFYGKKLGIYLQENNNSDNKNDWRRPVNIEYFAAPNEESKINQLGETRVAGGGSRSNTYKTLVLYANKRFHEQKRFEYEFFPEDRPGKTEFKSLMLRNSGNDFDYLYLRDAIMQRSFHRHVDLDYQGYSPAIIFFNGKYLGMLNLRERSNEDNIYTNYNKLEDIDMVENLVELKTGTWDNYRAFEKFYNEKGHTWEEYEEWMDCTEFINLMIMNIFYSNRDFPGNNIVTWRPIAEGGRWRWIAKDTDFGLGLYGHPYNYKTINWIYDNGYDWGTSWANKAEHTRLFRRLMDDPTFNREFIDRCAIYMGDFLNYETIWSTIWSPMYERIRTEYPKHRAMLNPWWPNYNDEMNNAKNWLKNRVTFFYNHLKDYFKLGTPIKMMINQELNDTELADIEVSMNGVKLSRNTFDGKFFQNREVKLAGKHVEKWEVTTKGASGISVKTYEGSECSFIMPNCTSVSVKAVPGESSAIDQIITDQDASSVDYYDVSGIRHNGLQKGQNIIRMSDGSVKKVLY